MTTSTTRTLLLETSGNSALRSLWEDYLSDTYATENWKFWNETNNYKKLIDKTERIKKAREIFSTYLIEGSPEEANIDFPKRAEIQKHIDSGSLELFDEANNDVAQYLEYDVARKFFLSSAYKENKEKIEEIERNRRRDHLKDILSIRYERFQFRRYAQNVGNVSLDLWERIESFENLNVVDPELLRPQVEEILETFISEGAVQFVSVSSVLVIPIKNHLMANSLNLKVFSAVRDYLFNQMADTILAGYEEKVAKESELHLMNPIQVIQYINERQHTTPPPPIKEILLEFLKEAGIPKPNIPTAKEMYLLVKSNNENTWTKLWVQFRPQGLYFYESDTVMTERNVHKFDSTTNVETCTEDFVAYCLKLVSTQQLQTTITTTYLAAKSESEMQIAKNSIEKSIKSCPSIKEDLTSSAPTHSSVQSHPLYPTSAHHHHSDKIVTINVVNNDYAIFGLFKTFFGTKCALFFSRHLPDILTKHKDFVKNPLYALYDSCIHVDERFLDKARLLNWQDGATGIIVYIRNNHAYFAITGDHIGVYCANGTRNLTLLAEISSCTPCPRVFGTLPLKSKRKVIGIPYVNTFETSRSPEFIILGTRHFWMKHEIFKSTQKFRDELLEKPITEIDLTTSEEQIKNIATLTIQLGPILSFQELNKSQFEDIFSDKKLFLAYREFLGTIKAKQNLSFYLEAQHFAKIENENHLVKRAQEMNMKYFEPLGLSSSSSPTINISYDASLPVRQTIQDSIKRQYCTRNLFEPVLQIIVGSMKKEWWDNFISSYNSHKDQDIRDWYSKGANRFENQLYDELYSEQIGKTLRILDPPTDLPSELVGEFETKDDDDNSTDDEYSKQDFKFTRLTPESNKVNGAKATRTTKGDESKGSLFGKKKDVRKPGGISIGEKERRTSKLKASKSTHIRTKLQRKAHSPKPDSRNQSSLDELLLNIEYTWLQIKNEWDD